MGTRIGHAALWAALLSMCAIASAVLEPFELSDVTLADDTAQARAAALNTEYLSMLEPDRLLWTFRTNAGLPLGAAEPFRGSWEDPSCEVRGQFMGHYLSALSFVFLSTGDTKVQERINYLVDSLREVQTALGGGYLSAFPSEHFDRLEALQQVWAPFYVIHKIMAGLLDAHSLAGNPHSLIMAQDMAQYFLTRIDRSLSINGTQHWEDMMETEFGGMNDVMYRMYTITRKPEHLRLAHLFDKPRFYDPLIAGQDPLPGLHANTHLAQVVGFASRYDAVADPAAAAATAHFYSTVTSHHSYATGGSSDGEGWGEPDRLADAILTQRAALNTEESCTQYNILKIARSLFRWTADPRLADFYERAITNGVLGISRIPLAPLGSGGAQHLSSGGHDSAGGGDGGHAGHHHGDHLHGRSTVAAGTAGGHGSIKASASEDHSAPGEEEEEKGDGMASSRLATWVRPSAALDLATAAASEHGPWPADFFGGGGANMNGTTNEPGPGVYLYLLPLGSGQAKGDNFHGWGYPFNSFWCCYGTAVESLSKLADSIYFKRPGGPGPRAVTGTGTTGGSDAAEEKKMAEQHPAGKPARHALASLSAAEQLAEEAEGGLPQLYVNQLVSSHLRWREMGVNVTMQATLHGPDSTARATIQVKSTEGPHPTFFTLMLRLPAWADTTDGGHDPASGQAGGHGITLSLNGSPYSGCKAGQFCPITRGWSKGDRVELELPMAWRMEKLPEGRPEYAGLHALMMGPFLMAGLTHDSRLLRLSGDVPLAALAYEPGAAEEATLVSVQGAWDDEVYLRHDRYHLYASALNNSGDGLDATFRVMSGCPASAADSAASSSVAGSASRKLQESSVRIEGDVVVLEAMNSPGFYVSGDGDGNLVLQRPQGNADAFCAAATFLRRKGLTSEEGTASFESVALPGHFVSAFVSTQPPCRDYLPECRALEREEAMCALRPDVARVQCRSTCAVCGAARSVVKLQRLLPHSAPFAAASTWRVAAPLRPRYPTGARVLKGVDRDYLLVPLANVIDERYTAYFDVQPPIQRAVV